MNLVQPLPVVGDMFLMDNSNLGTISTCPRSAFYKLLLKRRLRKSRAALFFGGAIHKALEIRDREQAALITKPIEEKMIDGLIECYEDVELDAMEYRNLDYAIKTIQKYNELYMFDPLLAITLPTGEVAVELPFALPVGEIKIDRSLFVIDPDWNNGLPGWKYFDHLKIIFTGKIDRVCKKADGETYLLDHKTSSMGGATFFSEFFTALQLS